MATLPPIPDTIMLSELRLTSADRLAARVRGSRDETLLIKRYSEPLGVLVTTERYAELVCALHHSEHCTSPQKRTII